MGFEGPSLEKTGLLPALNTKVLSQGAPRKGTGDYLEPRALRVERDGTEPLVVPLYPDRSYVFGRAPESTFVFTSDAVSRLHGQLHFGSDHRWVYRDLNSLNGSFLLKGPAPRDVDPRQKARRLTAQREWAIEAGQSLVLANGESRLVFLEEVPEDAAARRESSSSSSPASAKLEKSIALCARHREPVFLLGPSGSGKTHAARTIHEGNQVKGNFVLINCGRLPQDPSQLQSELLGHVKGGFTGAIAARVGKFQSAHEGTLFLDEVESLPAIAQDFLLDVLEGSGNFSPLGAPADLRVPPPRFRLISASKKPLSESGLRPDLCQRLAGDMVMLPTLDDRRADIPGLVERFLAQLGTEQQLTAELTPDAVRHLQKAEWPGQIRELETTVKVVVSREHARREIEGARAQTVVIGVEAVKRYLEERRRGFGGITGPAKTDSTVVVPPSRKRPGDLAEAELRDALKQCGGNKTHAAQRLGIAVNTLKSRLRALGIEDAPG